MTSGCLTALALGAKSRLEGNFATKTGFFLLNAVASLGTDPSCILNHQHQKAMKNGWKVSVWPVHRLSTGCQVSIGRKLLNRSLFTAQHLNWTADKNERGKKLDEILRCHPSAGPTIFLFFTRSLKFKLLRDCRPEAQEVRNGPIERYWSSARLAALLDKIGLQDQQNSVSNLCQPKNISEST